MGIRRYTVKYCEKCGRITDSDRCPVCNDKTGLREPKHGDWCLLSEREGTFAELALGLLNRKHIPVATEPISERGMSISSSMPDMHRIYVPWERLHEAEALINSPYGDEEI